MAGGHLQRERAVPPGWSGALWLGPAQRQAPRAVPSDRQLVQRCGGHTCACGDEERDHTMVRGMLSRPLRPWIRFPNRWPLRYARLGGH
jgi:hypothetical protein